MDDEGQQVFAATIAESTLNACVQAAQATGFTLFDGLAAGHRSDAVARSFFYLSLANACAEPYVVDATALNVPAVEKIAVATYCLCQYVLAIDRIVDHHQFGCFAEGTAALMLALEQLRHASPSVAVFNELKREVLRQLRATIGTVELERKASLATSYSRDEYAAIAVQKCCVADVVPLAVARCVAPTGSATEALRIAQVEALGHVHTGMQWIDDLADVAEDWAYHQPSLILSRLVPWCHEHGIAVHSLDDERLRRLAYTSGLAVQALNEAVEEFEAAKAAVDDGHMCLFVHTINSLISHQKASITAIKNAVERARSSVGRRVA